MLEESLLKTNFLGRDGFRWWIGQVAPQKAQGSQINGGGWGNRFKVRILGYHPYSVVDLPDEDLPWAQALLGCTDGSGAANRATSVRIAPGDSVLGFFLDGDNAQILDTLEESRMMDQSWQKVNLMILMPIPKSHHVL
jgi:hypothetical protein